MKKLPIGLQDFPSLIEDGYLTIKKIDATNPVRNKYFLSYPNEEVRDSFLKYLPLVGVAFDVDAKNVREWKQEEE